MNKSRAWQRCQPLPRTDELKGEQPQQLSICIPTTPFYFAPPLRDAVMPYVFCNSMTVPLRFYLHQDDEKASSAAPGIVKQITVSTSG